jgi:hypothetical protein
MAFRNHNSRLEQVLNHFRAIHGIEGPRRKGWRRIASALQEIGGGATFPGVQQRPVRNIHANALLRLGKEEPHRSSVTATQVKRAPIFVYHFQKLRNSIACERIRHY